MFDIFSVSSLLKVRTYYVVMSKLCVFTRSKLNANRIQWENDPCAAFGGIPP